ncbi:MAG: hypothetical protein NXH75_15785 [Halobacteriovoraceae bacterium]|nr:hypothetical protein [Halobacteriovoraceae bacterium]
MKKKENGKTTLGFPKNLNKLAEIIEDVEALSNLKKTWNLDEAYKLTTSISLEFLDHVLSAKYNLAEAIEILYELRRIENPKEVKDALFTISNRVKAIENRLSEED